MGQCDWLLICADLSFDDQKRINLLGVFDRLRIPEGLDRAPLDRFCAACKVSHASPGERLVALLKVTGPNETAIADMWGEGRVDEAGSARILWEMRDWRFPEGTYRFDLLVNAETLGSTILSVVAWDAPQGL